MRNNIFDFLRLCLASIVVFFHVSILSQVPSLAWIQQYFSATFAVQAFFTVSGFLIFMSYERSSDLRKYISRRAHRILPAYVCVIVLSVLAGAFITEVAQFEYWTWSGAWRYLVFNLLFMNYGASSLPGLFQGQYTDAVNGSLWTLKVEIIFYASVPVMVWACRRFSAAWVLILLYASSVIYKVGLTELAMSSENELYAKLAKQFPGQLSFFVAGAAAYFWRERGGSITAPVFIGASLAYCWIDGLMLQVIGPGLVAVIAMYVALWAPNLGNWGRRGDFSYGIYIYHFPVVQLLISLGIFSFSPFAAVALVVLIVLVMAFMSWHLIEKPMMERV